MVNLLLLVLFIVKSKQEMYAALRAFTKLSAKLINIKLFTSNVAMSGCPSPYTTRARYLARYMSFNATDARPALWQ